MSKVDVLSHKEDSQKETSDQILLVEDSRMMGNLVRKALGLAGYEVILIRSGLEALEKIKESEKIFKAVLLDLSMDDADGMDIIKKIRALPSEKSKTLVVAATGNYHEYEANVFREAGFNGYILKPFDCGVLLEALEELFESQADWIGLITE